MATISVGRFSDLLVERAELLPRLVQQAIDAPTAAAAIAIQLRQDLEELAESHTVYDVGDRFETRLRETALWLRDLGDDLNDALYSQDPTLEAIRETAGSIARVIEVDLEPLHELTEPLAATADA